MLVYISNIIVIIAAAVMFLDVFRDEKAKKLYFFLVAVHLSLVAGLRDFSVGPDTYNYVWYFKGASSLNVNEILFEPIGLERGYVMLEYIVSQFTESPTVFFVVIALFFTASVAKLIYENSSDPLMSFLLFVALGFFTFSMTGLRQTVALGIVLFSFKYIKKRKLLPFLLIVGFSTLFHTSSVIFLPAYFLAHKKLTKTYVLIAAVIIPASYVFKGYAFTFISSLSGYGYDPYANEGPYVLVAMMLLVLIAAFIQRESVLERDPENIVYYNLSLFSIVFAMLTFINPSALRGAYYYHIYLILFIPEIIFSIKDAKLKRLFYGIGISLLIFLEYRSLSTSAQFMPYLFFWQ